MARIFTPLFTSSLILIVLLIVAVALLAYFLTVAQADTKKANAAVATVNASTPGTSTPASVYHNTNALKTFMNGNLSNLKILCVGDSSTAAVSTPSIFPRQSSFPKFLADIIYNKTGRTLSLDNWFGYDSVAGLESKLYFSSNWYSDSTGSYPYFGIGGFAALATSNTSYMIYTPETYTTRFRVYLASNSGNISLFYNGSTSGISVIPANQQIVSGTIVCYTFSSSYQINSVKLIAAGATNSTPVRVVGMILDNDSLRDNIMINASANGVASSCFTNASSSGRFSFVSNGLATIAPNLVIFRLGASEMINGNSVDAFTANVLQAAKYVTSQNIQVLVVIPCWVGGSNDAAYINSLKSVLDTNSIAYYDLSQDFVDFNTQKTLGLTTNLNGSSSSTTLSPLGQYRTASGIWGAFQ